MGSLGKEMHKKIKMLKHELSIEMVFFSIPYISFGVLTFSFHLFNIRSEYNKTFLSGSSQQKIRLEINLKNGGGRRQKIENLLGLPNVLIKIITRERVKTIIEGDKEIQIEN